MTGLPLDPDLPNVHAAFIALAHQRYGLSSGDATILYHMARGITLGKEIAALCGRSRSAIKNHLVPVYDALGVSCNYQAVLAIWPLYREAGRTAGAVLTPLARAATGFGRTHSRAKRQGAAIAPLAREVA